ncbi:MAG: indole-3-glycerol phosphate synthase TrpC [Actinomycetota bacterium]
MSFLDELLTSTRARVAEAKEKVTDDVLEQRVASISPPRPFADALRGPATTVIAEIKRATPSKGPLNLDLDATALAESYERGGAVAISVLTEPDFFKGSLEDLQAAARVGLPVLRKDFVLDPFQILEARASGADSVLIIVRTVGTDLTELVRTSVALGMQPLVEVFGERDLDGALEAGARVIGINHRDLETFEVDAERTAKLAPRIPDDVTIVALSGVATRAEMEELGAAGAHSVLVGESLVTAPDPEAKLRELLGR